MFQLCVCPSVRHDGVVNVVVLARDPPAGHCDTVCPHMFLSRGNLPAPLFPHTSPSSSSPRASGCKQGQTCGSMEHVWEEEEGGGWVEGVKVGAARFFLFFNSLIMTHHF